MPKHKRQNFKQSVRIECAERCKDAAGVMRCEGLDLRVPGRCNAVLKPRKTQLDHIIPDWAGGKPTAENGQMLCDVCYTIKNGKDAEAKGKNDRVKARALGVETKATTPIPQRPKPEKAPLKQLPPRRGGIFARYFGPEEK